MMSPYGAAEKQAVEIAGQSATSVTDEARAQYDQALHVASMWLDEATSLIDPRAARHLERSLAAVLEAGPVPTRYFLSAKACAGILRRAEKRGRKLPEPLHQALILAATMDKTPIPVTW